MVRRRRARTEAEYEELLNRRRDTASPGKARRVIEQLTEDGPWEIEYLTNALRELGCIPRPSNEELRKKYEEEYTKNAATSKKTVLVNGRKRHINTCGNYQEVVRINGRDVKKSWYGCWSGMSEWERKKALSVHYTNYKRVRKEFYNTLDYNNQLQEDEGLQPISVSDLNGTS